MKESCHGSRTGRAWFCSTKSFRKEQDSNDQTCRQCPAAVDVFVTVAFASGAWSGEPGCPLRHPNFDEIKTNFGKRKKPLRTKPFMERSLIFPAGFCLSKNVENQKPRETMRKQIANNFTS